MSKFNSISSGLGNIRNKNKVPRVSSNGQRIEKKVLMNPFFSLAKFKTLQAKFLFCLLPPVVGCFLLFSLLQAVFTYQERREYIFKNLQVHVSSQSAILAKSLWGMNFELTADQVETMLLISNISGVRVVELTTEKIIERGHLPTKVGVKGYLQVESPIIYRTPTGEHHIGNLTVVAGRPKIFAPLIHSLFRDTLLMLVLLFVIVASAVTANRRIIGRPLALFLAAIRKADKEKDRQQVEWTVQDELGIVIRAYNNLLINVSEAEQAVMESEEKFRNVVERANDGIVVLQADSISYANLRAAQIIGYSVEEMLQLPIKKFVCREDLPKLWERYQRRLAGEDVPGVYETMLIHKSGKRIHVEVNAAILLVKGVPSDLVIIRDISVRKKAEQEKSELENKLLQAKKMEAIGLMAGGVAHDLNNILSGIVSYPELILRKLPGDSQLRKPLHAIHTSGIRAAEVVDDLLTVARGAASSREIVNLNTLIMDYLHSPEGMKLKSWHTSVCIRTVLEPALVNVSCSRVHITKCVMNLVTNAMEAVEGEGEVVVSTRNQYVERPVDSKNLVKKGDYTVISVVDSGSGISQEDLVHIFEPFYTKKVMGRSGTGLGLSVVWNTVQDHDGAITVQNSEQGTRFDLYLPATGKPLAIAAEHLCADDLKGQGEHILVVDDESLQRKVAGDLLSSLGYNISKVVSGEEAVEFVEKQPVDLVILDMIMDPGMNGRQTYEEMIKLRPGQKALIVSGFSETDDVKLAQQAGAGVFIKKPYTLNRIGLAVQQELLASGANIVSA